MKEAPFSAPTRRRHWESLGAGTFDVLVIGGGITGVGIARDAAGRGLRVALVEAGDLAGGTSSRSSRLVHGGLRYLERLELGLVFESLRERRRLLQLAPHLVRPLPFLFPVFDGDPTGLLKLSAGMWLYESLALFRSPDRPRILRREGVLRAEPGLRSDGLRGGAIYYDGQVDDARLTLSVARAAHDSGVVIVTHASVVALDLRPGVPGRVTVHDAVTENQVTVSARLVVNATGPWSDRVRRLADPSVTNRLRTTKGVHILVDRGRLEHRQAIIFRSAVDGRVMFVLPWGDFTYVGTTDTEFDGDPGAAFADDADIRYLLDSANALFPKARLQVEDIVSTWAGVRPLLLPTFDPKRSTSETSREHDIWSDKSGLLNVAGGKLTTYRSMAAEVVDSAAQLLHRDFGVRSGDYYTEFLSLPGAPETPTSTLVQELDGSAEALGLPAGTGQHLASRYGTLADEVLELIEADAELGSPVQEGFAYLWAEVAFAIRQEMALTVEDVLRRRLHLFYEARDGGSGVANRVAEMIAREDDTPRDPGALEAQIEAYRDAVRRTRRGSSG